MHTISRFVTCVILLTLLPLQPWFSRTSFSSRAAGSTALLYRAHNQTNATPELTVSPKDMLPPVDLLYRIGYARSSFPDKETWRAEDVPYITPSPSPTPEPTATPIPSPTPKPTATPTPTKEPFFTPVPAAPAALNTDVTSYTLLINKEYLLPEKWKPTLVVPNVDIFHKGNNERRLLQPVAAAAIEEMFAAAELDGLHLVMRCGYRSYSLQRSVYIARLKDSSYEMATQQNAAPGTSEHQSGLAIDVVCEATNYQNNYDFVKTDEYKWLMNNSYRYGFILRYPKGMDSITGITYEPWHFRYVGIPLATYLTENKLTLEEYYGAIPTRFLFAVDEQYRKYMPEKELQSMYKAIEEYEREHGQTPEAPLTPTPEPTTEPPLTPTPEPTTEPPLMPTKEPTTEPPLMPTKEPPLPPTPEPTGFPFPPEA